MGKVVEEAKYNNFLFFLIFEVHLQKSRQKNGLVFHCLLTKQVKKLKINSWVNKVKQVAFFHYYLQKDSKVKYRNYESILVTGYVITEKGKSFYRLVYSLSFIFCFQISLNSEVFQIGRDNNFHKGKYKKVTFAFTRFLICWW